jgi:hypothetical protein
MPSILLLSFLNIPKELFKFLNEDFYILPAPPNGWMNPRIFQWIIHNIVIPFFNNRRIRSLSLTTPSLTLGDGHNSRCSGAVFADAMNNNMDIFIEPAGSSDNLQANDRGINGPFKGSMGKHRVIKDGGTAAEFREQFVENMIDSLDHALRRRTVKAAWRTSGAFPLGPWGPLGNCNSVFTPPDAGEVLIREQLWQSRTYVSNKVVVKADECFSMDGLHAQFVSEKDNVFDCSMYMSIDQICLSVILRCFALVCIYASNIPRIFLVYYLYPFLKY